MVTLVYAYLLTGTALTAACIPILAREELARAMAAGLYITLAWPALIWRNW